MRISHRITFRSSPATSTELAALGVTVADGGVVTIAVDESDPAWPEIRAWRAAAGAPEIVSTTFTESELDEADWLEVRPEWHHGYPQPDEGNFGYLDATYDLSRFCRECGVGARQVAPFQLEGEPKWGRRQVLQVNWVFDEYFVTPGLWEDIFASHGVGRRKVIDRRGAELQTVVQLSIDDLVEVEVAGLDAEPCPTCGSPRFHLPHRGPFPRLVDSSVAHAAKAEQWFGSGGSAFRPVVISQALARDLRLSHARWGELAPRRSSIATTTGGMILVNGDPFRPRLRV